MNKKLTFLGIETSCDETAASIVRERENNTADVLSNIISSQIEEHKKFGGVVPELAARAHVDKIDFIIQEALDKSKTKIEDIDGIAATAGPGLIVCLTIGYNIGKSLAAFSGKPFLPINHLEGHALSPSIENKISFPYLLLLVSGGHSQYLIIKGINDYEQIGTTIDDAVGEAFDKTAKILDLGYPGGPKVEKFAKLGNKNSYNLPKPIINRGGCNLSLAGLKTAVLRKSKEINLDSDKEKYNLAASFQYTINKILVEKTKVAMKMFREKMSDRQPSKTFVVAGGVAANEIIRKDLIDLSKKMNFKPIFPSKEFCGDNAAMIAWAGIKRFKKKLLSSDIPVKSRWPLDKKAPFLKGPGLKL
ncbi:MAG: tRNA (adenosine(37)-N6)-threonylcarbamoyltransferase complex transferase subunit TsaD [Pelagibacteraceae bacterium]|nr:tRNA (adenosine(37)-N6)-threonylcarbamoyltransferase complex transferase subunit TsaD [Pelagibacteraceae bacterium]